MAEDNLEAGPAIVDEKGRVIGDAELHADMLDNNPEADALFDELAREHLKV